MVEGARLESVYTATYRGFESLLLRHKPKRVPNGTLFGLWETAVWMNPSVRPNAQRLAPSRVSGEARRAIAAPRLLWVVVQIIFRSFFGAVFF